MGIATGLKNIFIVLAENGGESNINVESDIEREDILKNDEGAKEYAKADSNIENGEKEVEESLTTDAERKENPRIYDIDSLRKRLGGKDVKGEQPQIDTKSKPNKPKGKGIEIGDE